MDYAPVTAADIAEHHSGALYHYSLQCFGGGGWCDVNKNGGHHYVMTSSFDKSFPIAISTESDFYDVLYYTDGLYSVSYWYRSVCSYCRCGGDYSGNINVSYTEGFSTNIPVFSSLDAVRNYLETGTGYEDAINFGQLMYDNITDNVDLPPFYKTWQQKLWERVANAPDIGIGSYGAGVGAGADDWADDIPWIGPGSLWDYIDSVQYVYKKAIDDMINGVYDPTKDIPDTYGEAWEDSVADTWDDVVDLPVDRPGVKV